MGVSRKKEMIERAKMYLKLSHRVMFATAHKTDSLCFKQALTSLPVAAARFLSKTLSNITNCVFYCSHHSLPITAFSLSIHVRSLCSISFPPGLIRLQKTLSYQNIFNLLRSLTMNRLHYSCIRARNKKFKYVSK